MTLYLDASVIVPLVIAEPTTPIVTTWIEQQNEPFCVGRLAIGEAGSAISRRRRMGDLTNSEGERALAGLDAWLDLWVTIIDHEPTDIAEAARLVRRPIPKLLMPDAIHLATCRRIDQRFVTGDKPLERVTDFLRMDCIVLGRS